jgi:pimeloyl-ACP methyl ester carboxylesterase
MAARTVNAVSSPSTARTWENYTTHNVTSKDGTVIGYRQLGHGPGLILVQGTMGTAQHFMELAGALADSFTVYVPDRRGRGMSGAGEGEYSIQKDVEDLDALLTKTGTHYVFGLSAGAIITLTAALSLPAIHKAAIFEPPLFIDHPPLEQVERYEREMSQGKIAAALVTAMKAAQMGPAIFNRIPNFLLEALVNMGLKTEDKKGSGEYPSMRELAGTLHYDFKVVTEMSGHLERFRAIQTNVLLLGGDQSPAYLKNALNALEKIVPNAARYEFPGLGHAAPWNTDKRGNPEPVAQYLRRFFAS